MDQKSSNGSGADKRNWRERLGIGGKDMPKISDEFKTAVPPPELKVPQPVARPAPMAPRAATPKIPPAPNAEALADKLRNQRAAAEKFAEQRVSAARERAEAKVVPPPTPSLEPSNQARPEPRAEQSKPKFMFADEELSAAKAEFTPPREPPPSPKPRSATPPPPPLVPPRPALGGDRLPPPVRPPVPPGQPQYRTQPPSSYRPIDPAAAQPPLFRASGSPPRSYLPGTVPPGYGDSRYGSGRAGQETHRRAPETGAGYGDGSLEGDPRLARGIPARARPGVPAEDYGDVFEDEPSRPRRRASASEYNSAYREVEDGYEDDRRRSSGPWLLLLALLIAAVATFGVIWYYQTHIKDTVTTTIPDNVPVVAAPEQPAKTAAEQPVESTATGGMANKKQIYDRIVGDQEVTGERIVPTEEPPIAPEAQQPAASETPQPPAATSPDSGSEPLALPPPPGEGGTGDGNTQGSIPPTPDQQTIASKITETDAAMTQPVPASDTAADGLLLPDPAETAAAEPAPGAPPEPVVKPTETKTTAEKKQTSEQAALGAEPVVLVPPAAYVPPASITGSPQDTAAANTQTETKKKKTLLDLFQGAGKSSSSTPTAAVQPGTSATDTAATEPDQQLAALPEPAPPQQQNSSSAAAGSGYVVQLASFRSETEAQTEYGRLKAKYPAIIGRLPPRISQATVSGSTRYRLGLGPLASRDSASKLCSSLVAAGERDCLVRKQ